MESNKNDVKKVNTDPRIKINEGKNNERDRKT